MLQDQLWICKGSAGGPLCLSVDTQHTLLTVESTNTLFLLNCLSVDILHNRDCFITCYPLVGKK